MTLVMLAGSSCSSIFSPARTLPLAASLTIHALPTTSGAAGTGSDSLAGAAASGRGCGAGCGVGVGANAIPKANVVKAAAPMARKAAGDFMGELLRVGAWLTGVEKKRDYSVTG